MNDSQVMKGILDRYGGVPDDHFKMWPTGKLYFFDDTKSAGLAYAVKNGVAIGVGAPAGAESAIKRLLQSFQTYCRVNNWSVAFCNVQESYREQLEQLGLKGLNFSRLAIVDIPTFVKETSMTGHFKTINNRGLRNGWHYQYHEPPHGLQFLLEIKALSDDWRKLPGRKDLNFLNSPYSDGYMQNSAIHTVSSSEGIIDAFINEVPAFSEDTANFDLMRRRPDSPNGVMDFLLLQYLYDLHSKGYKKLSLGIAMRKLDQLELSPVAAAFSKPFFKLAPTPFNGGLGEFKSKFRPEWEPRYIFYEGNDLAITKIALSIYQLMNSA